LTLHEFFPLLTLLGRYAPPVPLAHAVAARAVVARDVELPDGLLTMTTEITWSEQGAPRCALVPFGAVATHVLAQDGERLVLLDVQTAHRVGAGIPGSQIATLSWNDANCLQTVDGDASTLTPMVAAVHAALMAGAMARVLEMTLQYCNDRQQFGRPLGKFQAIQHQLSVMAEHVTAVSIAGEAAFETGERTPSLLRAAMAKARASEAVPLVADTAHALHGAMGVTEEHDLQLHTRRLREWRWLHGAETHWNRIVGEAVLAAPGTVAEFVRAI